MKQDTILILMHIWIVASNIFLVMEEYFHVALALAAVLFLGYLSGKRMRMDLERQFP